MHDLCMICFSYSGRESANVSSSDDEDDGLDDDDGHSNDAGTHSF